MSTEQREKEPLYIEGVVTTHRVNLGIEIQREKERLLHRELHKRRYEFYNLLWGDLREKRVTRQRAKYAEDPMFYRKRAREYYEKHYVRAPKPIPEEIMPECKLDCMNCVQEDCVLPKDWRKKAAMENWKARNPDYYALYRQKNRELLREKGRAYYEENRDCIRERAKIHRQKPEVREKRLEYDKKWRENNPERRKEIARRYYEKHRDEINARKRERRRKEKSDTMKV